MSALNLHKPRRLSVSCDPITVERAVVDFTPHVGCVSHERYYRAIGMSFDEALAICCQCECHYTREAFLAHGLSVD